MTADPLAALLDLPGVRDAVAGTRAAVDGVLNHRAMRRHSADISAESSLRGAWGAASLSGADASLEDVRAGSAAEDPLVQGALRAYAAIPSLADTWTRAPRQALARLHVLAGADLVPDRDVLGKPAPGAADRLDTLAGVLAVTNAPAALVAALVHAEVTSLDAFAPSSGIVAAAAVRLTLIERGLDPKSFVVVEAGLREVDVAAGLAGYARGGADAVGDWLRLFCEAVVAGARETTAICEALVRG